MDRITEFLAAYPKHYATVPVAHDGKEKRRRFQQASLFTRHTIFDAPYDFRTIVITGTNGKGSTGSILSTLFRESGFRIGVISSPAMRDDCTDMIRVNGEAIPQDRLLTGLKSAEKKLSSIKGSPELTHYMPICVAAYDYFREQKVGVVVAETAIGGLYDPTVPFKPDVCVFTNITKEHEDVLGDTLAKVARHKSRVIGTNSRVVLGEEITDDLAAIISTYASRQKAAVLRVDKKSATTNVIYDKNQVRIFNGREFCPSYQHPNLRLATEAFVALGLPRGGSISIDLDNPPSGIFPENRFEFRKRNGVTYLFDSAHNEDSYLKLALSLAERFNPEELSFFKGASTQESLDSFRRIMKPNRVTYVSGYHSRVLAQDGFVNLKDIDFEAEEKRVGKGVIVICGIFLAPKVKPLLFPDELAPVRPLDKPRRQVASNPNTQPE